MFKSFLPKDYADLLDFISPFAFKVIRWKQLLPILKELRKVHSGALSDKRIEFSENEKPVKLVEPDLVTRNLELSEAWANRLLKLYFFQILNGDIVYLDLRLARFGLTDDCILWSPGALRHRFSDEFSEGLKGLYEGYYFEDNEKLVSGLEKVGLLPAGKEHLRDEIVALLFAHFGHGGGERVTFEMKKFRESFHQLFVFLKENQISLPADFLCLGVYLVTLYLSLSRQPLELCVKACFLEAHRSAGLTK